MQHTTEAPNDAPKQYQCRHIFTDGHRCASPCLRGEEFCYYHHNTRTPVENPKQRRSRRSTFHLPLPDPNDRSGIQLAIGQVLQRIAANDIDPRRAGLLLYGLQIASLNLPKPQSRSQPQSQSKVKPETETETVEEITIDPTLGVLAPRAELSALVKPKSAVAQLIEKILQSEKEEEEALNPGINEVAAVPAIVPILQATQDDPDIAVLLNPNPKNHQRNLQTVISTLSAVERAAHLPPQWRNSLSLPQPAGSFVCHSAAQRRNLLLLLPLPVLSTPTNLQQPFTPLIPVAAQQQHPKFSGIHTP
jgi:hypothetical protein